MYLHNKHKYLLLADYKYKGGIIGSIDFYINFISHPDRGYLLHLMPKKAYLLKEW